MSESTPAIFLSYARDDAAAARRIAEALRASGLEVWFDENELRGGDTWDAKIRKQIDECTLFVPVISRHTQERNKGYFRLEWKLAVDQTHLLAAGVPFIAPVVIDETREAEALVPAEFMRVQWTRLPGALPTPQFVEQVKRLLSREKGAGSREQGVRSREQGLPGQAAAKAATPRVPGWMWGLLAGVLVAVAAGIVLLRQPAPPVVPPPEVAKPAAPAPRVSDKSIAVLPFTNMSEDKENAFFTDGIHEDILTNLALVSELRVVSRTSVMQYRDSKKPIGQIAAELGVTYILEGSVRREGNKVRVTGQLIHAATDEHVWAQAYDRDLTDIFAIQTELSQQIAGALKAALSPEEKVLIARRPTENPAAYDLFLRGRDVMNREGNTLAARKQQIELLKKAVELDPAFAQAWGELAASCAYFNFASFEGMDEQLALAKTAIDRAVQLAPDEPEVYSSLGTYYYYGYRDYARAAEQYERRARLQPNSPIVFNSLGLIQRRQGHWAESLVNSRRACELDPANIGYLRNLESTLRAARRWTEAHDIQRRIVTLTPGNFLEEYLLAYGDFKATGSTREMEEFFARLSPQDRDSPRILDLRKQWAGTVGNYAEAVRLDHLQPYYDGDGAPQSEQAYFAALNYYAIGDAAGAKARLGDFPAELRSRLEREPRSTRLWAFLGGMEAILGHKEEALRCVERAVELRPESSDALDGATCASIRAAIYDMTGEKEKALAEYRRLLRVPTTYYMNVYELRTSFGTLHGDPRFEELLNDPKNNAPLF